MNIYTKINGKEYKLIESQEEYDEKLKAYLKEMDYIKSIITTRPNEALKLFYNAMDKAEGEGLFDKEFCNEQRQKIIDGTKNNSLKDKIKAIIKKRKDG